MKKLFLTLTLATNASFSLTACEVALSPTPTGDVTGPLAIRRSNTSSGSTSHVGSPRTPRISMTLLMPQETEASNLPAAKIGFQVTPLTPPSSATTSPRTPAAQEVVQPTTPTKPSWEDTVAAYQAILTAAQKQTTTQDWTARQTARFTDAIATYNQEHPTTVWPPKAKHTDSRLHEAPRALTVFSSKQ